VQINWLSKHCRPDDVCKLFLTPQDSWLRRFCQTGQVWECVRYHNTYEYSVVTPIVTIGSVKK